VSDVREVVAKLLLVGQSDVDADAMWARLEPADREGWLRYADHHLAALRDAGLLVERGEWEWGVRGVLGDADATSKEDDYTTARDISRRYGFTVVKRRAAGEWEEVP
jgi:hypothetical protein